MIFPSICLALAARSGDITATANSALASTGYYQIPAGTSTIGASGAGSLIVPAGAILDSAGGAIVQATDTTNPAIVLNSQGTIRNLHLIGTAPAPSAYTSGTIPGGTSSIPDGIQVTGYGTNIEDCTIEQCGLGIDGIASVPAPSTNDTYESFITGCHVYNNVLGGIYWDYPSDSYITRCICNNAYTSSYGYHCPYGIKTGPHSGGTTITDVHVWNNHNVGLYITDGPSFINNARIEGVYQYGMALTNDSIHVNGGEIFYPNSTTAYALYVTGNYEVVHNLQIGNSSTTFYPSGGTQHYLSRAGGNHSYYNVIFPATDPSDAITKFTAAIGAADQASLIKLTP